MTTMSEEPDTRPEWEQVLWPRPKPQAAPARRALSPDEARPYATKAFNAEVDNLARTPEGERNAALNTAAFNLAQLVAGGYLERAMVWDTLESVALGIGLSHTETLATLRSGFNAGSAQPRVVPELEAHVPPPVTMLTVGDGWDNLTGPEQQAARDAAIVVGDDPGAVIERLFPTIDWGKLWADETKDEWIVEPLLPARRLVALFSPPKVGKSLLMLELAVRISQGLPTLGYTMERPYRVLYVDFENDPRGDVRSRLQAMGYHPDSGVLDELFYLSFPQLAHLDTAMGGMQLLAAAQHYGAEVVIIDTVSRAIGGEENANDTWLAFYRHTGAKLKAAEIACLRLDHTGKDASKGMRGGSAKYGDVDAVWSMTALTEDTFKLECTDNRLPVAEKELVLQRRIAPLRHEVDPGGRARVERERDDVALAWLRQLDPPWPTSGKGSGFPALWDENAVLRAQAQAAGVAKHALKRALATYKNLPTELP